MSTEVETTPTGMEPESAVRGRPFTEEAPEDAEGHAIQAAEEAPQAGSAAKADEPGDEDVEGHRRYGR